MRERCTHILHKALAAVRPQFRLDFADGIHGLPHWSRVWLHGRALAARLDVNPGVLAWFAFLHDSQRRNDYRDQQHGQRAADFAVRLRREGVLCELADPEFEHLCEAMRLHSNPPGLRLKIGDSYSDKGPFTRRKCRTPAQASPMYVIDVTHYLNDKGDIGPEKGPARKMADFITSVIAHASDFDRPENTPGPVCFKCRKRDNRRVDTGMTDEDAVVWHCPACGTDGRISNWQGTFWDLSQGMPSD